MRRSRQEKVRFVGGLGSELAARLDLPEGEPRAYVLFAHCFSCSKDLKAVGRISRSLVEEGLAVLRFDFTGLGESEGEFADTNFSSNLDDLVAAADFLRGRGQAPRVLVGHSLGGAAVIAAAARIPESVAVTTIGAPSDTRHVSEQILRSSPELAEAEEAEVILGGRPFRVKRQMIEDLESRRLEDSIRTLNRPLLVMHSPVDEIVGIDHAHRIYDAARHPKSFISLDGADHLLLARERDARFVGSLLAAWAARYLESDETGEPAADASTTPPGVRLSSSSSELGKA